MAQQPENERAVFYYMTIVSLMGIAIMILQLFQLGNFANVSIYALLMLFLAVVELFPIYLRKVSFTLSFPLVYTIFLLFGFPVAVLSFGLLVFFVFLAKRRPVRQLFFAPTQYAVSLFTAFGLANLLFSGSPNHIADVCGKAAVFTGVYFLVNNLLVDGVWVLRAERYPLKYWLQKNLAETCVALFSYAYLLTMFLLGNENRGVVDVFSFLFFFSPLVAICIITVSIVRLQKERNRLKALLSVSTEMNRLLFSKRWLQNLESLFHHFISVDAIALWVKVGDDWLLNYKNGAVAEDYVLSAKDQADFSNVRETRVYQDRRSETIPADGFFSLSARAFVFAPLTVENETVGMFVVGRKRSHSFTSEEVRSMATLANQMAVMSKTHRLISEQKKRLLLEERNRIAREIHDGVAQSLAGAVMKLETSQRLFSDHPEKAKGLMANSTDKLRKSLKEIRQSIYELRPNPTERAGLRKAIKTKIAEMEKEDGPAITFSESGQVFPLQNEVKRVMYELIQEALHNCLKHAEADHVEVRLVYEKDRMKLTIADDGIGFSLPDAIMKAQNDRHFGILNMHEQAEKVGASLQIDSDRDKGTTIQFMIKPGEEYEDDSSHVG
ncbi:MAG TPA: sensor histidine kinase [Bacillales bacterium]|nr:sensor histidine kinase [Bacillales bacterium]